MSIVKHTLLYAWESCMTWSLSNSHYMLLEVCSIKENHDKTFHTNYYLHCPLFTFYVNMDLLVVIWWVIDAPPSYAPHSSPAPHQWSLRNPGGRLYHPEPGPGESLGEKPGCQSCQTWIWDSGLTPTRYSSVDKCLSQQEALPPCQKGMNKRSDCSQLRQETAFKSQRTADDWLVFSLLSQNTRQKQFKNGLGLERWLCSEECEMHF